MYLLLAAHTCRPAGAWVHDISAFLHTFRISIALTIRSLDPRWGF